MNSNLWFQRHELKHELVFGVEPPQISLYFTSKERDVFKVLLSSSIILKVFQSFLGGGGKKSKIIYTCQSAIR